MDPLIVEVAIEPKSRADKEKMGAALNRLSAEDPSFDVSIDHETGQTIIKGISELHLELIIDRMRREFKVETNVGALQVAYREYLNKRVDIDYIHEKQSGGSGQFARLKFIVTPGEPGSGIIFNEKVKSGNIPKEYIPSIEKGMRETAALGWLIGFPITDFKIELYDGACHDVDSSALAFAIAASAAMREAARKSGIKLLEPIMRVEVVSPEESLGDVIGDMSSRRGQIQGTHTRGDAHVVEALVPLTMTFGYDAHLRWLSRGSAQFAMRFDHYGEVPQGSGPQDDEPMAAALRA